VAIIPDINAVRYAFWGDSAAELATLQAAKTAGITAATLLGGAPYAPSVVVSGLLGDGSDETARFDAAVAALPAKGAAYIYVPAGTYVASWNITRANTHVRGTWASCIKTPANATAGINDSAVRLLADYCTVEGIQVDGNKVNQSVVGADTTSARHADGIEVYANYCQVRNNYIHDTCGHGVIVWPEPFVSGVTTLAARAARHNVLIEGNLVKNGQWRSLIDVGPPDSGTAYNYEVNIIGNHLIGETVSPTINEDGITLHSGQRCTVVGNVIEGVYLGFDAHTAAADCVFSANVVVGARSYGWQVSDAAVRIAVNDNLLYNCLAGGLISDSSFVKVTGNVFQGSTNACLTFGHSSGGTQSSDCTIQDNWFLNSPNHGIDMTGATVTVSRIHVQNNRFANLGHSALRDNAAVGAYCDHITFRDNNCYNVGTDGTSCVVNLTALNAEVIDNYFLSSPFIAVRVRNNNARINGNRFDTSTSFHIHIDSTLAPTGVEVSDNRFDTTGNIFRSASGQLPDRARNNNGYATTEDSGTTRIDIDMFVSPKASVGTWTTPVDTACLYNGRRSTTTGTAAQNDSLDFTVAPAPGTWTFEMLCLTGSNKAIVTVQIDDGAGSFTTLGTIDLYAASTVRNVVKQLTGLVFVSTVAPRTLRLLGATKNASSSDYVMDFQHAALRRTA
jgi:hypothetical protein